MPRHTTKALSWPEPARRMNRSGMPRMLATSSLAAPLRYNYLGTPPLGALVVTPLARPSVSRDLVDRGPRPLQL